jgi:hypothetical protein
VPYLDVGCRSLVALVFLVSAAGKVQGRTSLAAFAASVRAFGLLPSAWAGVAAGGVIACELAVVPLVAVPRTAVFGSALATALLAAFTTAVALVLRRGRAVACRCFGHASAPVGRRHLVRNGLLMVLALGAVHSPGPAHPPGVLLAVLGGTAGALVLIRLEDLIDLFATPARST